MTLSGNTSSKSLLGEVLGGAYRIQSQLDEGGMGMVYQAEHVRLKRPVAVKVMAAHLAEDENAFARFSREAEIISQIHHPHVVQVLDFNTTESGQPYLVMELLRGTSLDSVMRKHDFLGVGPAIRVAIQVASALSAAHQMGVVHRDLKPANIFLVDTGDQLFVKVLDFGISKKAEEQSRTGQQRKLTGEFDILGTPEYMPPEQALGKTAAVDGRGDQYALAIILYEMLTGRVPFSADDVMELLQRVIRDIPVAPSELRPELGQAIDHVLIRALSKNPEDRYPSIVDFSTALEEAALHAEAARGASGAIQSSGAPPAPSAVQAQKDASPTERSASLPPVPQIVRQRRSAMPEPANQVKRSSLPPARSSAPPRKLPSKNPPTRPSAASTPASGEERSSRTSLLPTEPPTGLRRSSWHSKDPVNSVKSLVDRARQELGLDNLELAVNCAESALEVAQHLNHAEVNQIITRNARLFERIFEQRLGNLRNRLTVNPNADSSPGLSPEQAFLLSRLEGGISIEEALDLSPLSRELTLAQLVGLMRLGHIRLGA